MARKHIKSQKKKKKILWGGSDGGKTRVKLLFILKGIFKAEEVGRGNEAW